MNDEQKGNIAFLTSLDPRDRRAWSGTLYYMAQALQREYEHVSFLGPIDAFYEKLYGFMLQRGAKFFLKKTFVYHESHLVAKRYGRVATQKLASQSFDVIVAPAGAPEVAFLETDIPVVLVIDATYALLFDYYPRFSNALRRSVWQMHSIQNRAFQKASRIICASAWAARSAIEDYQADAGKVSVVPFGANLEHPPAKELVLQRKKSGRCRLLFLGVDWQRKGGNIAFETLLKLEKLGIHAELVVCGCSPPVSHERMKVIPFLNKNDERQRSQLDALLMASDFLLVPSRQECYGIVFCEACAFGLPIIATHTGGISEIVRDGENGFLLPLSAGGDGYAAIIASIYRDDELYARLVAGSRNEFDARLNWNTWTIAVKHILAQLPGRESSSGDSSRP